LSLSGKGSKKYIYQMMGMMATFSRIPLLPDDGWDDLPGSLLVAAGEQKPPGRSSITTKKGGRAFHWWPGRSGTH
jgi:hypothetical protein